MLRWFRSCGSSDDQAAIDHLAQFCRAIYSVPMERSTWRDIQHLTGSLLTDQSFIIKRDWVPKMADLLDQRRC